MERLSAGDLMPRQFSHAALYKGPCACAGAEGGPGIVGEGEAKAKR